MTAAARLTLRRAVSRFAHRNCPERSVWQIGTDSTRDVQLAETQRVETQPAEIQRVEIQRVETRSTTKTKVSVPQIPALGLPLEP